MKLREIDDPVKLVGKKVHFHFEPKHKNGKMLPYWYDEWSIVEGVEYTNIENNINWILHFKHVIHFEKGDFFMLNECRMSTCVWSALIENSEITLNVITDEQYDEQLNYAINHLKSWQPN